MAALCEGGLQRFTDHTLTDREALAAWLGVRTWYVVDLAVRPDHRMIGHTAFLVTARRLAEGVTTLKPKRRSGKG